MERGTDIMKKLLFVALFLALGTLAFGQKIPVCNANATPPVLPPNCTDYFGVGNWANSPVPGGAIAGFTLINGGSGYSTPVLAVDDPTGTGFNAATAVFTVDSTGVVTAITGAGGTNYTMPQVTIVDVGPGGSLAAPTCDGVGQVACGTGAVATAVIGPPYVGGVLKFKDPLKSLAIASPNTTTYAGSDFYVIGLTQYSQVLHSSLPATTLRGYCQLAAPAYTTCSPAPSYLGPVILAQKDRPVRILFKNLLPTGAAGNLFIPTDTTYMGAGLDPNGLPYKENRATLHLHGGATPWISDGTPHQWTIPVGETAGTPKGLSTANVPDMWFDPTTHAIVPAGTAGATNDPGPGAMTFYWTNQQGGRLMFYHDHAYGLTRLNVYAGEAAGYLLYDPAEETALAAATAPGTITAAGADLTHLIPLVIQDKTFVPGAAQLAVSDPTWNNNFGIAKPVPASAPGDLWFPHIYMPNQNPFDESLANGFGRWDYGAWFFPPMTSMTAANPPTAVTVNCTSSAYPGATPGSFLTIGPTPACPSCGCPITPNPSGTPEGFMDTPVVNGVAYPVLHVAPAAYRFQILSAGNDRSWNLSWFIADPLQANTDVLMMAAAPPFKNQPMPICTSINPIAVPQLGLGLVGALYDGTGNPINGTGLPANCWPNYGPLQGIPQPQTMWASDGRAGGAPDPRQAGPPWIQIGTEGGLLPAPVVIPATPINFEQNTRSITITSVAMHGLWLGPAERADVIVDFSKFSGKTLILYNDAPAPAPAFDSRLDYFTGDGDQTPIGGAPNTIQGYGPNTRTVMQVVVDGNAPNTVAFNLNSLKAAFATTATQTGLFKATQPQIIVPEAAYNSAYNTVSKNNYMPITADTFTFTPTYPMTFDQAPCVSTIPGAVCNVLDQKAIQELFTLDYGRMNATLGTEVPLTTFQTQTTVPLGYVDWPTELIQQGQTQLWKITHNGVDSHFMHFHLFNVQVVNRVGWDGSNRQPDPNELGWKDTVRMNPLEDVMVALQPITPTLPFPLPDSIRPNDVTMPVGVADANNISGLDPNSGNVSLSQVNQLVNFGWEYVWHCHILGHEENDMMRPIIFQVAPAAPTNLLVTPIVGSNHTLTWVDNSANETSFTIQRSTTANFLPTDPGYVQWQVSTAAAAPGFNTKQYGQTVTVTDTTGTPGANYIYRVRADDSFAPLNVPSPTAPTFQQAAMSSAWTVETFTPAVLLTPTPGSVLPTNSATFTWTLGSGLSATYLYVGSTGVGSSNLYQGTPGIATSATVNGLPMGSTIYVRLYSVINGTPGFTDYTYTTALFALLTPANGSTVASRSVGFTWAGGPTVTQWTLWLGTSVGTSNLSASAYPAGTTSATRVLPNSVASGTTIYVRLFALVGGVNRSLDYTFIYRAPTAPTLTAPVAGSLLGPTAIFNWTAATGGTVSNYYLYIGTTGPGSFNVSANMYSPTTFTATRGGLPVVPTLYVRIQAIVSGVTVYTDYTFRRQ